MPDTPDTPAGSSVASVLGFDFGTRVIGVAVGNRLSGARALATVTNGKEPDWQRIDALVRVRVEASKKRFITVRPPSSAGRRPLR